METNDYQELRRWRIALSVIFFSGGRVSKSLLVEFAIGEEARGTLTRSVFTVSCSLSCNGANFFLRRLFNATPAVAGQTIGTNLRSSRTHLRSPLKPVL